MLIKIHFILHSDDDNDDDDDDDHDDDMKWRWWKRNESRYEHRITIWYGSHLCFIIPSYLDQNYSRQI